LLDRILSPTIFSTSTNRRIFRGMVHTADAESWQRIFQMMLDHSRWDLTDGEVGVYLARSFDYVIDILSRSDSAEPCSLDPSGDAPLRMAKQVRRDTMRQNGPDALRAAADAHFSMPASTLAFAMQLADPLYVPNRSASN
jgi:hypothetical protein